MSVINGVMLCNDCGGQDFEWMHTCHKHKAHYCRGCECPACEEEEYYDQEHMEPEFDCGQLGDGRCMHAGSEHCDFDCPYRHEIR